MRRAGEVALAVRYGVEMHLYPWFMDRLEIDIVQHLDLSDQVLSQSSMGKLEMITL